MRLSRVIDEDPSRRPCCGRAASREKASLEVNRQVVGEAALLRRYPDLIHMRSEVHPTITAGAMTGGLKAWLLGAAHWNGCAPPQLGGYQPRGQPQP